MQIVKKIVLIGFFSIFVSNVNAEMNSIDIICDEWPPYQVVENKQVGGFSTKVVKIVLERMNVNIKSLKAYPWKRAITMIEKGEVDALFSANYTKERTEFAFYPDEEIVNSPWVMWVREEDELKFESLNDLTGKKVGLVRGYSYTPDLWLFVKKHENYDEVTDDEQNFRKLNAGRVDFITAELGNGLFLVRKLGIDKIIPLINNPIKSDGLYVIFNKKNVPEYFVNKFSAELKKLKKESLYQFLYDEYFNF